MNTKFTLKNFRVFDSKGVTIDLRPITLLTGCNSSGKSSIVKALMLLSDYFQATLNERDPSGNLFLEHELDFTKEPHNLLGNFSEIVNDKSDDKIVSMTIEKDGVLKENGKGTDVEIELQFKKSDFNELKNGQFKSVKINELAEFNEPLYDKKRINFNRLKSKFWGIYPESVYGEVPGAKTKIIYYFPILEGKLGGPKTDCVNFLSSTLDNELISKTQAKEEIAKVVDEFRQSQEEDFLSWYRGKEEDYFSSLSCNEKNFSDIQKLTLSATDRLYQIDKKLENDSLVKILEDSKKSRFYFKEFKEDSRLESGIKIEFKELFEIVEFLSYMYDENNRLYQKYYNYLMPEFRDPGDNVFSCGTEFWFLRYIGSFFYECFEFSPMQYVSSSVASIKRQYSLSDKDEFSQLLRRYFAVLTKYNEHLENGKNQYTPGSFLNKWVKEFDIGDHISIDANEEGFGITLRLHKKSDDKGSCLANSGYGITQLFSIMLNIEVAILETTAMRNLERTIAIEEPEIHLHPSYQSKLADMFYEAYNDYGIHFIVETHSEYLVLKSQVIVAQQKYDTKKDLEENCPFTTYYVPDKSTGEEPYRLGYRRDGKFQRDFGSGFYDEAPNLMSEML